jgi:cation:H+ antiporter
MAGRRSFQSGVRVTREREDVRVWLRGGDVLAYVLLIVGLVLLIKGADLLVDGASSLGKRLHVSDLVIGLTVVAFGTSAPELFVNLVASARGNTDIAIYNVVGSNLANVLLILGVASVLSPLAVGKGTVWREIPFSFLAAVVLGLMANDRLIDGEPGSALTRIDGLVLLLFFCIFLYYSVSIAGRVDGLAEHMPQRQRSIVRSLVLVVAGLTALSVGGNWIVYAAVRIGQRLGVSESLMGLTVVAVGTSLPELATSAVATLKKNAEIAVGNVVGSNIFNVFFVLGVSAAIRPLPFAPAGNRDIVAVVVASFLLFLFMFTGKRRSLDRWEGAVFVALYVSYVAFSFVRQ